MNHLSSTWRGALIALVASTLVPSLASQILAGQPSTGQGGPVSRSFLGYQSGEERRYVLGPPEGLARSEYAVYLVKHGRFDEARPIAEALVAEFPHEPRFLKMAGMIAAHTGDREALIRHLRRRLELYPDPELARALETIERGGDE